jgi:DNA repair and recombination protein RAD54B
MFKPFKPPLLKRAEKQIDLTQSDSEEDIQNRPHKKRRLIHVVEDSPPKKVPAASAATNAPRKPLLVVKAPNTATTSRTIDSAGPEGYYLVLW